MCCPLLAQVITAVIFSPIQFDAVAHAITGTVLSVLTIVQVRKFLNCASNMP